MHSRVVKDSFLERKFVSHEEITFLYNRIFYVLSDAQNCRLKGTLHPPFFILHPAKLYKQVCAFRKDVVRNESTIISASHIGSVMLANSGLFFRKPCCFFSRDTPLEPLQPTYLLVVAFITI